MGNMQTRSVENIIAKHRQKKSRVQGSRRSPRPATTKTPQEAPQNTTKDQFPRQIPLIRVGQLYSVPNRKVRHWPAPDSASLQDRFQVAIQWRARSMQGGGNALKLNGDHCRYWFYIDAKADIVIKIRSACAEVPEPQFWVYANSALSVRVEMQVRDTFTGTLLSYSDDWTKVIQADPPAVAQEGESGQDGCQQDECLVTRHLETVDLPEQVTTRLRLPSQ